jgi:hypothetical protein
MKVGAAITGLLTDVDVVTPPTIGCTLRPFHRTCRESNPLQKSS